MSERTMMYVIDDEYRILYANDSFHETYPEISKGQECYRALGGHDSACSHCPLHKAEQTGTFYNVATGEWVKAQAADMDWQGQPGCHTLLVRAWQGDEENPHIESLNEEIRLQRKLHDRELELKEQQDESGKRLAIIRALSREYGNVYYVDLEADTFEIYRLHDYVSQRVKEAISDMGNSYSYCISAYVEDCVFEQDKQLVLEALSAANIREQLTAKNSFVCNYRTNRENGAVYYQVKCVRMEQNDDDFNVIVGFRDVDEETRKEMEQKQILADAFAQADYANRAKTTFLSNMSHDIRTPMNAILGMTAIAAMHVDDRDRVLDALNKITLSGRHLLGLINSVLDMSKIESGKISLNEEEFELPDTIDGLVALFHSQMVDKNQELKVNIATIEHEHVIGDDHRLQQIFVNIMGNAVKFTPEGGTISIDIREKHSEVAGRGCYEFVFEDNGIGMEQDFVDRIFEPFARAADSRTTKIEGTGLGMSIAVNIARMMGGDIQVQSELGKGSRFTVTVYLRINEVTEEDLQIFASLPVLVVDDEETACESACEILNSLDMQAEYVLGGDEAVARVKEVHADNKDFAVVILDWRMPGKDGVETAREIRKTVGNEIPIIILSAYDWSDIEQEALAAGVNAFIEKPLFKSRLTYVLKEVLGVCRNAKENARVEQLPEHTYKGRRVLLVEDNELNVEVATELLKVMGLEADVAFNGKDAVAMVAKQPKDFYDLIFMDIQMPVMNGYEAAKAVRCLEREDLKKLPIIAMTADAFAEDVKKAREAGMNGHIAKPIDIGKLEEIAARWMK